MPRPLNHERDAAIAASYQSGLTLEQAGALHGVACSHVARILERLGIPRRPGGGGRPKPERDRQIADLYAAGLTTKEVAERVGMASVNGVIRALARMGIPRRSKGSRKPSGSPAKTERNAAIVQAYRSGLSLEAVGAAHGISRSRVQGILKSAGEPRRPAAHLAAVRPSQPKPEPGPRFADLAPIVPAGVKVTVCPSGKDHRFTVSRPEPFFARGVSLPPSPWVAAVTQARQYGGQR